MSQKLMRQGEGNSPKEAEIMRTSPLDSITRKTPCLVRQVFCTICLAELNVKLNEKIPFLVMFAL